MVGICGGYTTFSSFSLETLNLMRNGEWFASRIVYTGVVVFCLIGVWLGHIAAIADQSLRQAEIEWSVTMRLPRNGVAVARLHRRE